MSDQTVAGGIPVTPPQHNNQQNNSNQQKGNKQQQNERNSFQSFLEYFWDLIDISENIVRTRIAIKRHADGLGSLFLCALSLIGVIVFAALSWRFDVLSTMQGMRAIEESITPTLPESIKKYSDFIFICITLAPTVIELGTSAFAKMNVKSIQLAIIGLALFDLATDIPVAYEFILTRLWPNIADMSALISFPLFYAAFFVWLLFSTFLFELITIIMAYAAFCYLVKSF